MICFTYNVAGREFAMLKVAGQAGGFVASGATVGEAINSVFNKAAQAV